jgi:hypothetical protein
MPRKPKNLGTPYELLPRLADGSRERNHPGCGGDRLNDCHVAGALMNQEHEYVLLGGVNRGKVGRYLALASASVSAAIVFVLLTIVDIASRFGIPANLPPDVLSLVGAGSVFGVLYWFFNRYAWRWGVLAQLLKVPNLSGEWVCSGESLNSEGAIQYVWVGSVTITQSWDKLRVRLKTAQSGSNSISAAVVRDEIDGFILLYHYQNDPRIGEPELRSHRGFAEITFSKDLKSGEGDYFNGHGRYTFGRMKLTRA